MIAAQMHRAEDLVDGHTVLLLDRLNRITSHRRPQVDLEASLRQVVVEIQPSEIFGVHPAGHAQVEMLFAHLKRILRVGRLRLRGAHDER
jgi:hypothetical protein